MNVKKKVAVCICTYKRPKCLRRLLQQIQLLSFTKVPVPDIVIIVVDNEGSRLTEEICNEVKGISRWPLRYETESERGISYARNKALASVPDDVDFVAFIDDDETPSSCWLDELLYAQEKYAADVVSGPAVAVFRRIVPLWLKQLFTHPHFETGALIEQAATNNALVRKQVLERMRILFDNRFALSGGGDAYFFEEINRAGYKLVWAASAIAYEFVPPRRFHLKWALLRRFRWGNVRMKINLDTGQEVRSKLYVFCSLGFYAFWNVLGLIFDVFRGPNQVVLRLARIFQTVGGIMGLLGINYEEYAHSYLKSDEMLDD